MTVPSTLTRPPTAFLSGVDPQAKQTVGDLLIDLGWRGENRTNSTVLIEGGGTLADALARRDVLCCATR
ncbi:hypothetical protein ACIRST_32410 [Kitasatospora sp. NPDC101447]|uniref:hypothetical protein n=1 Tax=Kitasatospora sp. NPDC101447 TaxID=3364102 RepID=UPI003818F04E